MVTSAASYNVGVGDGYMGHLFHPFPNISTKSGSWPGFHIGCNSAH